MVVNVSAVFTPSTASPANGVVRLAFEDALVGDGNIVLPDGATLLSLIDRNVANVGDSVAYRYVDFTRDDDGQTVELTWAQLGRTMSAIGAAVQAVARRGDRVAILAPQGLDYVAAFFATVRAGAIAVPLFPPELPGHAERLETALRDAEPSVVLTTRAVGEVVRAFLDRIGYACVTVVFVDEVPDDAGAEFRPVELDLEDVSHLQYTSGATRPPVGVEVTHRAVGINLLQMILSIDLLDRATRGVSWLPLYHDMGLSMIGFPAVYGGHATLMSPTAFIRRPMRWIRVMSDEAREGRVVSAAPNFAYEWTAQRARPADGTDVDLADVVLVVGSEPVSIDAIAEFTEAFSPHGLPRTALKPSYGIAEATLFVSTIAPDAEPTVAYFDRDRLEAGVAVPVPPEAPAAVPHVSCGQAARGFACVIVDPDTRAELPDGQLGEIWLHGNNIGRGYWGRPEETERTFRARLRSRLPDGAASQVPDDGAWLRTGDLGTRLRGELYVIARLADVLGLEGRMLDPRDVERTAADASRLVRRGYAVAFAVDDALVIVAERATGTALLDPDEAREAIRAAAADRHRVVVSDVRLLAAGALPRTTSGKLARTAARGQYLRGELGVRQ